ncbi:uncharacterized protein [Glycine max]|uniref:uncharacterized protein n=1 Tax=Glycine max TaxID=3847 RepID=UPI0003DE9A9B|nr:uncharacterized protein LOC102659495 [Glycine max]|eukprot:XP_006603521.1 uncharacterized protein LOC102659495 [Glycine max]
MRSCKDKISDEQVVDKILRTLPPRLDRVAIVIEESRNLDIMEIEELQHSLEAHEMRINERRSNQEQALQARSTYKGKGKGLWKGNKSCSNQKHQDQGSNAGSESSKGKKNDLSQKRNDSSIGSKEWKFDKRKVRCHNYQKLGHYARECWQGEDAKNKPNNQANLAQDEGSDSEVVMLMATTSNESSNDISWYLDSGCSTHMTGRKEWFIRFDDSSKSKVHFADDNSLTVEGIGRVAFRDTNGKETIIEEVLYVFGLKTNLLSLGQLLQKGFVMTMEDNCLKVFDRNQKLVIQANLSQNRTFQIGMNILKHQCFATSKNKEE